MSCNDIVCGTGGWTGPKPGDPDNNSILSAVPAYGGIDVSWTYPATNPSAVVHVQLYRGITNKWEQAIQHKIVSGNFYYDKIPANQVRLYYYWIRIVSINGTVGEPIGPASATPKLMISEVMEQLTGQIDASYLSNSLRGTLGEIDLLRLGLDKETADRLINNETMAEALAAVQSTSDEALTYMKDSVRQLTDANQALVTTTNAIAAGLGQNAAGLVEERAVRATAVSALATKIEMAEAKLGKDVSSVRTEMTAGIVTLTDEQKKLGALWTAKVDVNGLIGGFGVFNDGKTVEAGFDVDTFWVGRTKADKVKPFIISNGATYINSAVINKASITTLKLAKNTVTVPQLVTLATESINLGTDIADFGGFSISEGTLVGTFTTSAPEDEVNNLIIITGRTGFLGGDSASAAFRFGLFRDSDSLCIWDSGWAPFISVGVSAAVIETAYSQRTYTLRVKGRYYVPSSTAATADINITILGGKR